MRKIFFLFLLCIGSTLLGQTFVQTNACDSAHHYILQLKFERAEAFLQEASNRTPQNLYVEYLRSRMDFLKVFLSEEEEVYDEKYEVIKDRIQLFKESSDEESFHYLSIAEGYLQLAMLDAKFQNNTSAAFKAYRGHRILEEGRENFPEEQRYNLAYGLMNILIGSVPEPYQKYLGWFGLKGTIPKGLSSMESLKNSANNKYHGVEAFVLLSYTQIYLLSNYDVGLSFKEYNFENNTLLLYMEASRLLKMGETKKSIETLKNRPTGEGIFPFHHLTYMEGKALMFEMDPRAKKTLISYINNYKGEHYIKSAYMYLSWYAFLDDDMDLYNSYREDILVEGTDFTGADKQALRDLDFPIRKELIRVTLLFDGAYYEEASAILETMVEPKSEKQKLEYLYRRGSIALKLDQDFHTYFDRLIDEDNKSGFYYAPNAALMLAKYYEKQNDKKKALKYYNKALDFNDFPYERSIHQKSKAGISRLKDS